MKNQKTEYEQEEEKYGKLLAFLGFPPIFTVLSLLFIFIIYKFIEFIYY